MTATDRSAPPHAAARELFEALHRFPELSWQEFETARRIRAFLESHGLTVRDAKTTPGLLVDVDGARPGRRLFVRADIDALPIREATDLPYASDQAGVMHACGHDFHASAAAAAAAALGANRDAFVGSVRFAFQPAEEATRSGAKEMVASGDADGCDAFVAMHVDPKTPVGTFSFRDGPMNASVDAFRIALHGHGGHSSRPHLARDPVRAAVAVATALNQLTGHAVSVQEPVVLAITVLRAGEAMNVIPADAELQGTLRASTEAGRRAMRDAMAHVVERVAATHAVDSRLDWISANPPVINDPTLGAAIRSAITERFGTGAMLEMPHPSMGADDFAYYAERGPVCLVRIGTQTPGGTNDADLHAPDFRIDLDALPLAIDAWVAIVHALAAR